MSRPIYLDNNATTPVDPAVLDAMLPFLKEDFGNAGSSHAWGRRPKEAVAKARSQVARLIGAAEDEEVVFTSGATESNNLAIKGVLEAWREKGDHVVTLASEHKAVLEPCHELEQQGRAKVTVLEVGKDGLADLAALKAAITGKTVLVSVMYVNNEIGVIQDIPSIGRLCREKGVLFHTDATQAVGKLPVDVEGMEIDLLSMTGHKMYGPKGTGALYVRKRHPTLKRLKLAPLIDGGGQERGIRPGTLNVPGIVGVGAACALAQSDLEAEGIRIKALRDRLWSGLAKQLDGLHLNGHAYRRQAGNLSIAFERVDAQALMEALPDIALSAGAACAADSPKPSHVLKAIHLREDLIFSTIRFGIGRYTTDAEIDTVVAKVVEVVQRLRKASPLSVN